MVLFREDEKRIKEQERQERLAKRTALGRWMRRIVKFTLIGGVLLFFSLTLLAALGGTHPALKKGIEDYLHQATGLKAEIGEFKHMGFFPRLELDASRIILRPETGDPVITVGRAAFSTNFFDLMFSRRKIKSLVLEEFYAAPGIVGAEELSIAFFGLKADAVETKPAFILEGSYGNRQMSGFMVMARDDSGAYVLPENSPFNLRLGDMFLNGETVREPNGSVNVHIDTLEAPEKIASGDILITRGLASNRVRAELAFGASVIKTDIKYDDKNLKGEVTFPLLDPADLAVLSRLQAVWAALPASNKQEGLIDLYGWEADIDVKIEALMAGERKIGALSFPVKLLYQELTAGPLAGTLKEGVLSGKIYADARALPAALTIDGVLKGWSLGSSLRADTYWKIQGKSRSYAGLVPALAGEVVIIAGGGTIDTFQIGASDIVDMMLPGRSETPLSVTCMIADFEIGNGIARPQPLFIDMNELRVRGEGQIDLAQKTVALKLEPKLKDASREYVAAINIAGTLGKPEVAADDFSLFEKAGAAADIVDPAFGPFSMADLGLADAHPCLSFIAPHETPPP